jgi:hypothetical protein
MAHSCYLRTVSYFFESYRRGKEFSNTIRPTCTFVAMPQKCPSLQPHDLAADLATQSQSGSFTVYLAIVFIGIKPATELDYLHVSVQLPVLPSANAHVVAGFSVVPFSHPDKYALVTCQRSQVAVHDEVRNSVWKPSAIAAMASLPTRGSPWLITICPSGT